MSSLPESVCQEEGFTSECCAKSCRWRWGNQYVAEFTTADGYYTRQQGVVAVAVVSEKMAVIVDTTGIVRAVHQENGEEKCSRIIEQVSSVGIACCCTWEKESVRYVAVGYENGEIQSCVRDTDVNLIMRGPEAWKHFIVLGGDLILAITVSGKRVIIYPTPLVNEREISHRTWDGKEKLLITKFGTERFLYGLKIPDESDLEKTKKQFGRRFRMELENMSHDEDLMGIDSREVGLFVHPKLEALWRVLEEFKIIDK